jgi:hypothetical protein
MTEPTPPRGPADDRAETRPFAAPVPPQQPPPAGPVPAEPRAAAARTDRRGRLVMGAAAAGLLAVGVAVGVVVGQATAGSAAADTGSTVQPVPGDGPDGQYGTPPDGRAGRGGPGDFAPPDGTTDDGGTGDGTTGDSDDDGGDATT